LVTVLGSLNPFLPMCPIEKPGLVISLDSIDQEILALGPGPVEADGFFGGFRVNGEMLPLARINFMVRKISSLG